MAKILLIDDDELVVYALTRYLKKQGHEIIALDTGTKALETVESEQPDIVVTDLIMPDSDGLEVIMKLRHAKSEIPIIAMSGGGRVVDASHLESADIMGANATLQKPFDEAELNNLILKLVN